MASFEGSGVREVRQGRNRTPNFEPTTAPSVRQQVVPHAVPRPVANTDGLAMLSASFGSFFNKAQTAVGSMMEAEEVKARQRIVEENEEQQRRAVTDALAGRREDPAYIDDLDYTKAYTRTSGKLGGQKLFTDWMETVYANAAPGMDLMAETENYLKVEFGGGTGDPDFDMEVLATFKEMSDRKVSEFQADSVKALLADGLMKKDAEVGVKVRTGNFTVSDFDAWTREYRAMDPMNPGQAPARAMAAIINSAGNDLASVQRISSFIHQKGTGSHPDASFYESFPAQAQEIDAALNQKYEYAKTLESTTAYDRIEEILTGATDLATIGEAGVELQKTLSRHGKGGRYDTLRNSYLTAVTKQADTIAALNRVDEMVGGVRAIDVSEVRKYQADWFKAKGIDPMAQPGAAAQAAAKMGVVGEDLKINMSRRLGDFADPQNQAAAFLFYRSLESGTNGSSFAVDNMSADVRDLYQMTKERYDGNPANLVKTLEWVNENRDIAADVPSLTEITGKPVAESVPAAERRILSAVESKFDIGQWFGRSVVVSPMMRETILAEARKNFAVRNKHGKANWEDTLDATVNSMGSRLELLPVANGKYSVVVKEPSDYNAQTGERLVPFGPAVFNPETGRTENTAQTFRNDFANLSAKFPEVLPDTDMLSVGITPELTGTGVYQVFQEGEPLALTLGDTMKIGGEKVTLPDNPEDALTALSEALGPDGERLVLRPFPPVNPVILYVGYQPGFLEKRVSLDEKIDMNNPAARAARKEELDQRMRDQLEDEERLRR